MTPELLAKIDWPAKVKVRIIDKIEDGGDGSVAFEGWAEVQSRQNNGIIVSKDHWFAQWDEVLDAKFLIEHTPGHELIETERDRQIHTEEYTPQSDDTYTGGELVNAAIAYLQAPHTVGVSPFWPWMPKEYKPTPNDRVRELVKAGALIAAEIDRVQRLENKEYNEQEVN